MWRWSWICALLGSACADDAVAVLRTVDEVVAIPMPAPAGATDTLYVDRTPVTVGAFATFVAATNFISEAERFGNAGVFDTLQRAWILAEGAFWRKPFGKTAPDAPADHPVTQVSYADAAAYCRWQGKRLPNQTEWMAAARYRQPSADAAYPWGSDIKDQQGRYRANVWQGLFPHVYRHEDGYFGTSPVGAYGAHPSGLVDMAGNVWEWVTDSLPGVGVPGDGMHRLTKGGSFLCEPGWCHGYLITGSTHTSSETGLFHTGFRCVCNERPTTSPTFAAPKS